jgi:hypothetical protein
MIARDFFGLRIVPIGSLFSRFRKYMDTEETKLIKYDRQNNSLESTETVEHNIYKRNNSSFPIVSFPFQEHLHRSLFALL